MTPLILALLGLQAGDAPLSPDRAREAIRIDAGLRVELAAAEPQVSSPVAAAFDEHGRLYVVEMLDYPVADKTRPPLGRVKLLEDLDRDGRFEKDTVFADRLLMANGVACWKGGVVVTVAGEVLYLKDTDGDSRADLRETWYRGFATQNEQLRASFPTLGPDNAFYVSNGQRGGQIRPAWAPDAKPLDIGGQDFRFDAVRPRHEAVTGQGQFGLTFDDWGRRFVCTNRNHLIPLVMPNAVFARNPHVAPPPPVGDDNRAGGAARVFPISTFKTLAASHAGAFTASCGIWIYKGDRLPDAYRGNVFTCEPTGNLVHRETVIPDGAGFAGRRVNEGVEFLASTDVWFRPVSHLEGPDGALYVVDMARKEVEHPEWVPADLKHRYDWAASPAHGRIWRIVPDGGKAPDRPKVDPVEELASPNGWTRMTAHRLILEKQDPASVKPLLSTLASTSPQARYHAAWLLEGLGALADDAVAKLVDDVHPRVREAGLLLADRRMGSAAVRAAAVGRAGDDDARVRWAAAIALGGWDSDEKLEPLARILEAGAADRWTRLAVATSVPSRAGRLLMKVLDPVAVRELAAVVGSRRDAAELAAVTEAAATFAGRKRSAALNGLADGLARRGSKLSDVLGKQSPLLEGAAVAAEDVALPPAERLDALRLLAHLPWEAAAPALDRLLGDAQPQEVRIAAVAALSPHDRDEVASILLKSWKTYLPALRREVLEALARRPERIEALLGDIEAGRIAGGELGPDLIRRLTSHGNAPIRDRARKALQGAMPPERAKVLEAYRAAPGMTGDLARGREVFAKTCAACHRIGALGKVVGPDVSDTLSKSKEQLLGDILDPSRAIDNNYVNFLVRTKSGNVLSGYVAAQTASSLTLRRGEGQEDVVLKQDIDEMKSSGVSLMPEGLEKNLSIEAMADLLAFLKGWRDLKE